MKRAMITPLAVLAVALATLLANPSTSRAASEQDIRTAADQFYAALKAVFAGDAGPMIEVWSHHDDVTYLGPTGGVLVGWAEVKGSWEAQARAGLRGSVEPEIVRVVPGTKLGITVGYERGENFTSDGTAVTVDIRVTNVFRLENGTWKMIGHHTDIMPWLREELNALK